jgi:hypothetical protein
VLLPYYLGIYEGEGDGDGEGEGRGDVFASSIRLDTYEQRSKFTNTHCTYSDY